MNVWNDTALLGMYTLSATHFGTGQTTGAVDLPIARDAATGFPVLPASGIKGVMRDYAGSARNGGLKNGAIDDLFGKQVDPENKAESLAAGRLAFTEARLVAYPVRSLNRGFLHVTCPLILDGVTRDLRSLGGDKLLPLPELLDEERSGARVADAALADDRALVLEDLVYTGAEFKHSGTVETLASNLAGLIPSGEEATRARFRKSLVVIADADFKALMEYVIPVQARIKLGPNKTTDDGGNLWYEERLPSDCLFLAVVGERRSRESGGVSTEGGKPKSGLKDLLRARAAFAVMQIGGNETVGNGLCLCTVLPEQSGTGGQTQ